MSTEETTEIQQQDGAVTNAQTSEDSKGNISESENVPTPENEPESITSTEPEGAVTENENVLSIPVLPIEKEADEQSFSPLAKISPNDGEVLSVDTLIEALYSFKKNGVYLATVKGSEIIGGTYN